MAYLVSKEDGQAWHTAPYEWKSASVTAAGTAAGTDLKTASGFTTLFDTVKRAHHIKIETTGATYVRLGADGVLFPDVITVTATTPYEDNYCVVDTIYVSTNGSAATITVKLR